MGFEGNLEMRMCDEITRVVLWLTIVQACVVHFDKRRVLRYLMHLSGSVNFRFLIHVLFPLYLKTNMDSNGLWGTLRNGKVYTPGMYIGEQGEK